MSLQEQIKKDLAAAMKAKDDATKDALRVIMGELGRQASKEISDDDVIKILKKLIKSEKEVLEKSTGAASDHFILIAENYLPRMAAEAHIKAWIAANIDFKDYKNKMQAMKPIMAHFGAAADGNLVKKVLSEL
jgi:uncharacterized protein